MRLDHIAYRTKDRNQAAKFFIEAFGYRIQTEFKIEFDDGTTADCIALEPPERTIKNAPWIFQCYRGDGQQEYHLAPEIFISDGTPESIVGKWVAENGPGIHHIAYMVDSVEEKVKEWKEKGYAEFSSDEPMKCEGLTQIFTRPSAITGVVYEFIERGTHGFCEKNVKKLMTSSTN